MADRIAEIEARAAADSELLRAASSNSDEWDDDTWAAWARIAERAHGASGNKIGRLRDELAAAREEITELKAKLAARDKRIDDFEIGVLA